ncbi:unnamed protein product [Pleuronectes platessa]|uniref:Uncharacterized protein n=1 Tax=Pleuronectes platessa TaxID=8262 RepID=A0A9N7U5Q6_PLEPL|nr:unnamed protein product [Pleuronectes platessa]
MVRLLLEDMASDKKIFNCVKENLDEYQMSSSPYLRELTTAVCKAAVKEEGETRDSKQSVEGIQLQRGGRLMSKKGDVFRHYYRMPVGTKPGVSRQEMQGLRRKMLSHDSSRSPQGSWRMKHQQYLPLVGALQRRQHLRPAQFEQGIDSWVSLVAYGCISSSVFWVDATLTVSSNSFSTSSSVTEVLT